MQLVYMTLDTINNVVWESYFNVKPRQCTLEDISTHGKFGFRLYLAHTNACGTRTLIDFYIDVFEILKFCSTTNLSIP